MGQRSGPDDDVYSYQVAAGVSDLAEVYNHLAGFASLDGRGRVLVFDDFKNDISAWTKGKGGTGLFPSPTIAQVAFIAPTSVILDPGVGGTVNDFSSLVRLQVLGQSNRLGIEAAFYNVGTNGGKFILQIQYNYNSTIYQARLKYTPSTGVWQVQTPTGDSTITTQSVSNAYAQAKLVADFSTGKYVRVIIGENEYPASTLSIATTTAISLGTATYWAYAESIGAGTTPIRLGYVLVTRDEP